MDDRRFAALARVLGHVQPRRALLPLARGLLAAPWLGFVPTAAKKKKNKKSTLCLDGQTIKASKKKKKKLIKSGATPGACSACAPICSGTACGGDDGCGGICGCAAGSLCHGGVCQACNVTCTGDGAACGDALKPLLNGGGTVFACPGRYVGNFEITAANVSLIGAGAGKDPATSTILDANGSGLVLAVYNNVNAVLHGLRITGGNAGSEPAGGIFNGGALAMTACTVSANRAKAGGGITQLFDATGPLTLTDCDVSGNTATEVIAEGGGIKFFHATQKLTLSNCIVSGNTATGLGGGLAIVGAQATIEGTSITGNNALRGGGIVLGGSTVTLDSASSITENTATNLGGGIFLDSGSVQLNGANLSGNTPDDCGGAGCCAVAREVAERGTSMSPRVSIEACRDR